MRNRSASRDRKVSILDDLMVKRMISALRSGENVHLAVWMLENKFEGLLNKVCRSFMQRFGITDVKEFRRDVESVFLETALNWNKELNKSASKYITSMFINNFYKHFRKMYPSFNLGRKSKVLPSTLQSVQGCSVENHDARVLLEMVSDVISKKYGAHFAQKYFDYIAGDTDALDKRVYRKVTIWLRKLFGVKNNRRKWYARI